MTESISDRTQEAGNTYSRRALTNRPVRRPARPRARSARDSLIVVGGVAILALAVIGLVSTVGFLSGLGASPAKPPRGAPVASINRRVQRQAQIQANRIIRSAEQAARAESALTERQARRLAEHIIRQARTTSRRLDNRGGHGGAAAHVATAPATSAPAPAAVPTRPVTTGPALPSLAGVPSSWQVVTYNANPAARSADIYNRAAHTLAGTIMLRFYGRRGRLRGTIQGNFLAPAGSTAVVPLPLGMEPARWFRYQLSLTGIHS